MVAEPVVVRVELHCPRQGCNRYLTTVEVVRGTEIGPSYCLGCGMKWTQRA